MNVKCNEFEEDMPMACFKNKKTLEALILTEFRKIGVKRCNYC